MKKSKFFAAALAATMFATAACGLVACDKDPGELVPTNKPPVSQGTEYTVTFSGTNVTKTTSGGKLSGTMPTATDPSGKQFKGWAKSANATTPDITTSNYESYPFSGTKTTITLYPVFETQQGGNSEYTITLDATTNGGSCSQATATTVGKVLSGLPTATKGTDTFNGWFTAPTGGTMITASYEFDGTVTTIYAQFTSQQQGGVTPADDNCGSHYASVGSTPTYALEKTFDLDDGTPDAMFPSLGKQYAREGLVLRANTTLSFTIDGAPLADFYIDSDCKGLTEKKTRSSTVTTNFDDTYNIYIKQWSDSGDWTITMQCVNNEDDVVVVGGEAIAANTGYLVGDVAAANISWDNWREGAIKLEEHQGLGGKEYKRLDVTLSAGDSFKFIFVGATTDDNNIQWVSTLGNTKGNLIINEKGDVAVKDPGVYDFYVSFADNKIYYDYTPA